MTGKVVSKKKFKKAYDRLKEKVESIPGGDGLINLSYRDNYGERKDIPKGAIYVHPTYGFHCGFVGGDRLKATTEFAKALVKACTLCRNFIYDGCFVGYAWWTDEQEDEND